MYLLYSVNVYIFNVVIEIKFYSIIIDRFPRSHHRPPIIKVPSLVQPIAGKPVKRWNFRKAKLFTAETERRTPGPVCMKAG